MNLDIMYDKTHPDWEPVFQEHRLQWIVPNIFMTALYIFKNRIPNIESINTFLETGTNTGRTSEFFSRHVQTVHTVEMMYDEYKNIYMDIKERCSNINFYQGTSPDFLKDFFQKNPDERCVILLDAHHGANTPLKEELRMIKENSRCNDHIIIIDDCLDAGTGTFPSLKELQNILYTINPNYNIEHTGLGRDVIIIF